MNLYSFEPLRVAASMQCRYRASLSRGETPHAFAVRQAPVGVRLAVGLHAGAELFVLELPSSGGALLESPFGKAKLSPSDLASTRPNPLWDAVDSICAHMEQDHADTFPTFLGLVGRSVEPRAAISMPWVEESGFFLSLAGEPVFVPFPRPCPAADDVRAAMIRMLRNARAGGVHTP